MRAARVTPVQMVTISTTPSTQPRSVVWRAVKPKEDTMICFWFVREFGILLRAAKSTKSHVFGSVSASIILHVIYHLLSTNVTSWENTHCSTLKCLFSTPVWFSYRIWGLEGDQKCNNTFSRRTAIALSAGVRNQAFVGESGNRNLETDVNQDWGRTWRYITKIREKSWGW